MSTAAHDLLHRLRRWPFVRIVALGDRTVLHCGGADTPIAELHHPSGALSAFLPADVARALVRAEPRLHLTGRGARVVLVDDASHRVGERLLRARIDLERFGAQLREASP